MTEQHGRVDDESARQDDVSYYNPRPVDPLLPVRIVVAGDTTSSDGDGGDGEQEAGPLPSPPPSVVAAASELPPTAAAAAAASSSPPPRRGDAALVRLHLDPSAAAAMDAGASASASVALLCNSAVGAGVLALPYALARAGLAGGLLACALFCACEAFTLYVLAKFAERYRASSYGQLVRRALGRRSAALLSASMFVLQWGACVAYLVIVGDSFADVIGAALAFSGGSSSAPPGGGAGGTGVGGGGGFVDIGSAVVGGGGGHHHPHTHPAPPPPSTDDPAAAAAAAALRYRAPALVAVALGVVFPLCLPTDLAALERVSAAAVLGFGFTAFTVVLRGWQLVLSRPPGERLSRVRLWPAENGLGLLDSVPIIVFGFNAHANVVAIFDGLTPFPTAPRGARRAARRAAAAMGGLGSRVGSVARSLAQLPASSSTPPAAAAAVWREGMGFSAEQQQQQQQTPPPSATAASAAAARALAPQQPLLPGVRTSKLFGMVGVIVAAMALIALGYVLVAVAGFVAFAPLPPSNILLGFPATGDALVTAARLVIGLVVVGHYPLAHHPAREALRDLIDALSPSSSSAPAAAAPAPAAAVAAQVAASSSSSRLKAAAADAEEAADAAEAAAAPLLSPLLPPPPPTAQHPKAGGRAAAMRVLTTALFVASTLVVALSSADLGGVLHLLGGTVASAMIFGLPGLLLVNASIIKLTYRGAGGEWGDEGGGEGDEDAEEGEGEEQGAGAAARRAAPLLPKRAGIRERGLIYSPGASWWAGVAMIGLCALVMGLTLASALR